jgi:hypothetical protein
LGRDSFNEKKTINQEQSTKNNQPRTINQEQRTSVDVKIQGGAVKIMVENP